jgi:hypothetical protein
VSRTLRIDLAIAVAVALLIWIVSPGYAISGMLAIVVLIVCGVSLRREARRRRARRGPRAPRRPPPRTPRAGP